MDIFNGIFKRNSKEELVNALIDRLKENMRDFIETAPGGIHESEYIHTYNAKLFLDGLDTLVDEFGELSAYKAIWAMRGEEIVEMMGITKPE